MSIRILVLVTFGFTFFACSDQHVVPHEPTDVEVVNPIIEQPELDWVSSVNLTIATHSSHSDEVVQLTSGAQDYKPVFSPDGSQVAFFRIIESTSAAPEDWKTSIMVVNSDGTGLQTLTSGDHTDWNPMWARDGTNRVIFTRFFQRAPYMTRVYMVDPSGEKEEELVSEREHSEFAYSGLKDGRILVRRLGGAQTYSYWLLYPDTEVPTYQMLDYPDIFLHKMSISPSEKKITYMKVVDGPNIYSDAVIAYADFDAVAMTFSNEKVITSHKSNEIVWYPCWNQEESHIIYSHIADVNTWHGRIMAYDLAVEGSVQISRPNQNSYWYPNVKGVVK